jgi:hypothetical protein
MFDRVRVPDVEITSPHKIIVTADKNNEQEQYEENKSANEQKKLLNSFLSQIVGESIKIKKVPLGF